jgi:hypothetical protein
MESGRVDSEERGGARPGRAHSDASTILSLETETVRGDTVVAAARQSRQTDRCVQEEVED